MDFVFEDFEDVFEDGHDGFDRAHMGLVSRHSHGKGMQRSGPGRFFPIHMQIRTLSVLPYDCYRVFFMFCIQYGSI